MAKEKKCPPCVQNVPAYMMTYGDLMTLLVVFFVLLLSFSSVQESEFNKASGSLRGALGVLMATKGSTLKTNNLPLINTKDGVGDMDFKVKRILKELEDIINKSGMNEMLKFSESKNSIHFSISNPMMFVSGSATLNKSSFPVLEQISKIVNLTNYQIKVEGHTDNIPIRSRQFANNWELSMKRSLSVAQYLIQNGVDPKRFVVVGYGEYRPIAENSTKSGREKNRRVEIYIDLKKDSDKKINKLLF